MDEKWQNERGGKQEGGGGGLNLSASAPPIAQARAPQSSAESAHLPRPIQNAQRPAKKGGKNGEKMGEIRSKTCAAEHA